MSSGDVLVVAPSHDVVWMMTVAWLLTKCDCVDRDMKLLSLCRAAQWLDGKVLG